MKYQLVALGPGREKRLPILQPFLEASFQALGLDPAVFLEVLDASQRNQIDWKGHPVGIWFGGGARAPVDDFQALGMLQSEDFPILPLVEDRGKYRELVPDELHPINGRQWDDNRITGDVLRLFRLTRNARQAFISYRRADSQPVADQLFDELSHHGYLPFLDTASVESAAPVQEVLRARLADMDLVLFLDTPTAPSSPWILEELSTAQHLGLGVLQIVWPKKPPYASAGLSRVFALSENDFEKKDFGADGVLSDEALSKIIVQAEQERIESLGFRRRRVISEFVEQARSNADAELIVHPIGPIEIRHRRKNKVVAWALPFLGLPNARTVQQEHQGAKSFWSSFGYDLDDLLSNDLIERGRCQFKFPVRVIYDTLGVEREWHDHLEWLSFFLPSKTVAIDRSLGQAQTPVLSWLEEVLT